MINMKESRKLKNKVNDEVTKNCSWTVVGTYTLH